jgi:predicted PurR-regulated permease PerM
MFGIDRRAASVTWTAALVILLLFIVYTIRGTLFVFTISLLLAYLLYPLVDRLEHVLPSRSRTPAVALVFLSVVLLMVILTAEIGSQVLDQANSLALRAPEFVEKIRTPSLPGVGAPNAGSMRQTVLTAVEGQVRQHYNELAALFPRATLAVLSASTNLIFLVIVPILSFFLLKDGRLIRDELLTEVRRGASRQMIEELLADIHALLLQFMRALFLLGLATFTVFSVVFSLMGVPYALLLASIAFPLEFIPIVGPLTAAVIILITVTITGYPHVLWVLSFLAAYRLFQDYVLSPHLMSAGVELHPLLVLFGVFAGGELGGIAGTFLSVPILALSRILYRIIRRASVAVTA